MLEAMRAGVTEVVTEPVTRDGSEAAISPAGGTEAGAGARARSSHSSAPRAASARPPWRSTSRRRWRSCDPAMTLLIDLHVGVRRRRGVPRRRAAVLGRRRAREHPPSGRGVLPRPARATRPPASTCLCSSDRGHGGSGRRAPVRALIEFAVASLPRTSCSTCRARTRRVLDALERRPESSWWPTRNWPTVRSASRMAGTLRQRYGKEKICRGGEPLRSAGGDRPGRCRDGAIGGAGRVTRSRATTGGRCRR